MRGKGAGSAGGGEGVDGPVGAFAGAQQCPRTERAGLGGSRARSDRRFLWGRGAPFGGVACVAVAVAGAGDRGGGDGCTEPTPAMRFWQGAVGVRIRLWGGGFVSEKGFLAHTFVHTLNNLRRKGASSVKYHSFKPKERLRRTYSKGSLRVRDGSDGLARSG